MTVRRQPIFLVEDNDDDADLATMAFSSAKVFPPIVRARDGVEALDYLFARGPHADRDPLDLPSMVLLDIKLPRLSGLEVLKAIRSDERTRLLPIVVLTSSNEDRDRSAAYQLFANSYVLKPVDYDQFSAAALQLGLYWISLNVPPPKPI
jgi:two-component system response regulator